MSKEKRGPFITSYDKEIIVPSLKAHNQDLKCSFMYDINLIYEVLGDEYFPIDWK